MLDPDTSRAPKFSRAIPDATPGDRATHTILPYEFYPPCFSKNPPRNSAEREIFLESFSFPPLLSSRNRFYEESFVSLADHPSPVPNRPSSLKNKSSPRSLRILHPFSPRSKSHRNGWSREKLIIHIQEMNRSRRRVIIDESLRVFSLFETFFPLQTKGIISIFFRSKIQPLRIRFTSSNRSFFYPEKKKVKVEILILLFRLP